MTDLRKAAEMALKILENKRLRTDEHLIPIVIDDLRQALAQPEQDWSLLKVTQESLREHQARIKELEAQIVQLDVTLIGEGNKHEPAPPRKPWVGLTDEQLSETYNELYTQYTKDDVNIADFILIAYAIEAKLKEKNNAV